MIKHPAFQKLLFCIACVFAGWVAGFAMPPVSFWPCLFLGISGLYWLYSKTTKSSQAFATGFFFALGYFVTNLWWIGNALLVEGNEYKWVWPISVIGLPTLLSLFTGTYLSIARMAASPTFLKGFFAFAFFLTFSEWARGTAFTGFPWNLYGYVWAEHLPMAQASAFIGAYGLTFLSVLWAGIIGYLFASKTPLRKAAIFSAVTIVSMSVVFIGGHYRLKNNPTTFNNDTAVIVAQPNIPQTMKWDPAEIQKSFDKIIRLSSNVKFEDSKPKHIFVVWPETAISPQVYTKQDNIEAIRKTLRDYTSDTYLITGILRREDDGSDPKFSNSVAFSNADMSEIQFYKKTHLVPYGEYIPFQEWIPLAPVVAFRGFEPGDGATTLAQSDAPPFSPLICYEIIFPDDVIGKHLQQRPEWIVNVTNDGWYGDSAGPHQHFAQTRLRAIEEGLPVARSANTGISGIIDPYGRVIGQLEIFKEGVVVSRLPNKLKKFSPYWPWATQPILFLAGFALMLRLVMRPKKSS